MVFFILIIVCITEQLFEIMALPSTYKQIAINQQSPARKCYTII